MYHHTSLRRRDVLRLTLAASVASVTGGSLLLERAGAAARQMGTLGDADANGWRLPAGFRSEVVATSSRTVGATQHTWHGNPDGGAVFAQADGSYIYVSNSEQGEGHGGVGALHFEVDGSLRDARTILSGASRNCAGGATPWGTWLSCEEHNAGRVWECDPTGVRDAIERPAMGYFNHEAAAADADNEVIYLTEDRGDGALYRFVPDTWGDLSSGQLQVLAGRANSLRWAGIEDPTDLDPATRHQVADTVTFNGGEGIVYEDDAVFFGTKGDNRVWQLLTDTMELSVVYDRATAANPVLGGVDNLAIAPNGDLVVCEDADDMQLVMLSTDGTAQAFAQLEGAPGSELTGAAFDPSGHTLYVSSQRDPGITYAISGPFAGAALQRFAISDPAFAATGSWITWEHSSQGGGSSEVTDQVGSSLSVRFRGDSLRIIGQLGPNRGTLKIVIDGESAGITHTRAATFTDQVTLFEINGLAGGAHLLEIHHIGEEGKPLVINAVEARSISAPPDASEPDDEPAADTPGRQRTEVVRLDHDDPNLRYDGRWSTWGGSSGSLAIGHRPGAKVELDFVGSTLRWFGQRGPDRAVATITIDDEEVAVVDTHHVEYETGVVVFETTTLANTAHRLEITHTGVNDGAGVSDQIAALIVDAFEVEHVD